MIFCVSILYNSVLVRLLKLSAPELLVHAKAHISELIMDLRAEVNLYPALTRS